MVDLHVALRLADRSAGRGPGTRAARGRGRTGPRCGTCRRRSPGSPAQWNGSQFVREGAKHWVKRSNRGSISISSPTGSSRPPGGAVLALRRREPGTQGLGELRLGDRREPEPLAQGVGETGDHLVAAAHHGLAPCPGGDALQPPWLLEDRVHPGDRVAGPFRHHQRFGRDRRMLNHILSFPSTRSCSSHHAATGLPRMSVTP